MSEHNQSAASRPETRAGWRNWLEVPLVICGALTIFLMMFLSVSDAFLRSFLNRPIFGANDYTQIILSFAVAISLPLCVLAGRVIAIDTLVKMFPAGLGHLLGWVTSIIGAIMMGYLAWRAYLNAVDAGVFAEATLLLQLPYGPSYYAIAISSAFATILLILERFMK